MKNKETSSPIEEAILGSLLLNNDLFGDCQVYPYHFSAYKNLADLMFSEYDKGVKVDAYTIATKAQQKKLSTKDIVYDVASSASTNDFVEHCDLLITNWTVKQEIDIHEKAVNRLNQGHDLADVLAEEESEREIIGGMVDDKNETRVSKVNRVLDTIISAKDGKVSVYTSSGYTDLDKLIYGVGVPGRLGVVGARPGMGKTTVAWDIVINAAESGCPVAFYSLEMTFEELSIKYIQRETGISSSDMATGKVTDNDLKLIQDAAAKLYDLPIYVEDNIYDLSDIRRTIRQYRRKYGIKFVVIDYLQLIANRAYKGFNTNDRVAIISREMKQIAAQEKIEVWELSQLSRSVETRGGDKRPMLSDLRDSGAIEQDANLIMFVYRPEYYEILEDHEGQSLLGITDILVQKNRGNNRGRGDVRLKYDLYKDRYCNNIDDQTGGSYSAVIVPNNKAEEIPIPF